MAKLLGIDDTLAALVGCVCSELADAGRPTCECGTTIGIPQIATCCECQAGVSGELWGHLVQVYRSDMVNYGQSNVPQRPCAPAEWAAEFTLTLARCFPTIDEQGELPDPEERAAVARTLHADVAAIHRALHCCVDTEPVNVVNIRVDTEPTGGCSYLVATIQAPVSLRPDANPA